MDTYEKFYNRALRFLSYRPRSEKEIRDYLLRHSGKRVKRVHPESDSGQARMTMVNQIINKLKDQNFVNDEEFVRWWVEQRTGSKPKGFRLIKMELQQKGIDKDAIEKMLGEYDTRILSVEGARRLLVKVLPRYRNLPPLGSKQKLSQFLLRRGFEWETVKVVVDEIIKREYNTGR